MRMADDSINDIDESIKSSLYDGSGSSSLKTDESKSQKSKKSDKSNKSQQGSSGDPWAERRSSLRSTGNAEAALQGGDISRASSSRQLGGDSNAAAPTPPLVASASPNRAKLRASVKGAPVPSASSSPVPFEMQPSTAAAGSLQQVATQKPPLRETGMFKLHEEAGQTTRRGSASGSFRDAQGFDRAPSQDPSQQQPQQPQQPQQGKPSGKPPASISVPGGSGALGSTSSSGSGRRGTSSGPAPPAWDPNRLSKTGSNRQLWGEEEHKDDGPPPLREYQQQPQDPPSNTRSRGRTMNDDRGDRRNNQNQPPRSSGGKSSSKAARSTSPGGTKKKKKRPPGHIEKDGTPYWMKKLKKKIVKGKVKPTRPQDLPMITPSASRDEEDTEYPTRSVTPPERQSMRSPSPSWANAKLKSTGNADAVLQGKDIKPPTAPSSSRNIGASHEDDEEEQITPYQKQQQQRQQQPPPAASMQRQIGTAPKQQPQVSVPDWLKDSTTAAPDLSPKQQQQQQMASQPQEQSRAVAANPWEELYQQQQQQQQSQPAQASPWDAHRKQQQQQQPLAQQASRSISPVVAVPPEYQKQASSQQPVPIPKQQFSHRAASPLIQQHQQQHPVLRSMSPAPPRPSFRGASPARSASPPVWSSNNMGKASPTPKPPKQQASPKPLWAMQKPALKSTAHAEAARTSRDIPSPNRPADYQPFVPQPFEDHPELLEKRRQRLLREQQEREQLKQHPPPPAPQQQQQGRTKPSPVVAQQPMQQQPPQQIQQPQQSRNMAPSPIMTQQPMMQPQQPMMQPPWQPQQQQYYQQPPQQQPYYQQPPPGPPQQYPQVAPPTPPQYHHPRQQLQQQHPYSRPPIPTITSPVRRRGDGNGDDDDDFSISGVSALTEAVVLAEPPESQRSLGEHSNASSGAATAPSWASGSVKLKSTGKKKELWPDGKEPPAKEEAKTDEEAAKKEESKKKKQVVAQPDELPTPVQANTRAGSIFRDEKPAAVEQPEAALATAPDTAVDSGPQDYTTSVTTTITVTTKTNRPDGGGMTKAVSDAGIPAAAAAAMAAAAEVNKEASPPAWQGKLKPTGLADSVMKGVDIKAASDLEDSLHRKPRRPSWQRPPTPDSDTPFDEAPSVSGVDGDDHEQRSKPKLVVASPSPRPPRGRATIPRSAVASPVLPPIATTKQQEPVSSVRSSSMGPSTSPPKPSWAAQRPKLQAIDTKPTTASHSVSPRSNSLPPPTTAHSSPTAPEENTVRARPLWAAGRPSLKATGHADDVMKGVDIKARSAFSPALTPRSTALQASLNSLRSPTEDRFSMPISSSETTLSQRRSPSPYRVALRSTGHAEAVRRGSDILQPEKKIHEPEKEEFLASLAANRKVLRRVSKTESDLPSDEEGEPEDGRKSKLSASGDESDSKSMYKVPLKKVPAVRTSVEPSQSNFGLPFSRLVISGSAKMEDVPDGSKKLVLSGSLDMEPPSLSGTEMTKQDVSAAEKSKSDDSAVTPVVIEDVGSTVEVTLSPTSAQSGGRDNANAEVDSHSISQSTSTPKRSHPPSRTSSLGGASVKFADEIESDRSPSRSSRGARDVDKFIDDDSVECLRRPTPTEQTLASTVVEESGDDPVFGVDHDTDDDAVEVSYARRDPPPSPARGTTEPLRFAQAHDDLATVETDEAASAREYFEHMLAEPEPSIESDEAASAREFFEQILVPDTSVVPKSTVSSLAPWASPPPASSWPQRTYAQVAAVDAYEPEDPPIAKGVDTEMNVFGKLEPESEIAVEEPSSEVLEVKPHGSDNEHEIEIVPVSPQDKVEEDKNVVPKSPSRGVTAHASGSWKPDSLEFSLIITAPESTSRTTEPGDETSMPELQEADESTACSSVRAGMPPPPKKGRKAEDLNSQATTAQSTVWDDSTGASLKSSSKDTADQVRKSASFGATIPEGDSEGDSDEVGGRDTLRSARSVSPKPRGRSRSPARSRSPTRWTVESATEYVTSPVQSRSPVRSKSPNRWTVESATEYVTSPVQSRSPARQRVDQMVDNASLLAPPFHRDRGRSKSPVPTMEDSARSNASRATSVNARATRRSSPRPRGRSRPRTESPKGRERSKSPARWTKESAAEYLASPVSKKPSVRPKDIAMSSSARSASPKRTGRGRSPSPKRWTKEDAAEFLTSPVHAKSPVRVDISSQPSPQKSKTSPKARGRSSSPVKWTKENAAEFLTSPVAPAKKKAASASPKAWGSSQSPSKWTKENAAKFLTSPVVSPKKKAASPKNSRGRSRSPARWTKEEAAEFLTSPVGSPKKKASKSLPPAPPPFGDKEEVAQSIPSARSHSPKRQANRSPAPKKQIRSKSPIRPNPEGTLKCESCSMESEFVPDGMIACEMCKEVYYCTTDCMEWHWSNGGHANACKGNTGRTALSPGGGVTVLDAESDELSIDPFAEQSEQIAPGGVMEALRKSKEDTAKNQSASPKAQSKSPARSKSPVRSKSPAASPTKRTIQPPLMSRKAPAADADDYQQSITTIEDDDYNKGLPSMSSPLMVDKLPSEVVLTSPPPEMTMKSPAAKRGGSLPPTGASSAGGSAVRRTKPRHCANCNAAELPGSKFKYCGKCRLVKYCTRHCQKKNWSVHKTECGKQIQTQMFGA